MFFTPESTAQFSPERPRPTNVFNSPDARVLVFALEPGQETKPHSSTSTVLLTVLVGHGYMTIGDNRQTVSAGSTGICPPGELHGFEAVERMVVQAVIAPKP